MDGRYQIYNLPALLKRSIKMVMTGSDVTCFHQFCQLAWQSSVRMTSIRSKLFTKLAFEKKPLKSWFWQKLEVMIQSCDAYWYKPITLYFVTHGWRPPVIGLSSLLAKTHLTGLLNLNIKKWCKPMVTDNKPTTLDWLWDQSEVDRILHETVLDCITLQFLMVPFQYFVKPIIISYFSKMSKYPPPQNIRSMHKKGLDLHSVNSLQ